MEYDENNVYGSGLNASEWHALKDAILNASLNRDDPERSYEELSDHLKQHEIGQLVAKSLSDESNNLLDKAVKKMVGGQDNGWLALMKS